MKLPFYFEIIYQSKLSRARVGRIYTPHGIIETPNFVPVGTNATLKALDSINVDELGVQLMFCNTYHLLLQPGTEVVKKAGGLHTFMNRKGPIITDSGGFQVFSLAYGTVKDELKSKGKKKLNNSLIKITEEGALFRSYRDGQKILLTPETSIQAQKDLGADIIIPLDELPPYHISANELRQSFERTHRWEKRSLEEHLKKPNNQAIYAVVHGGINKKLREESAQFLQNLPFDGFAIGGSVGKNRAEMQEMLAHTIPLLPYQQPIHLLGIGDLPSLDIGIRLGIDTFDSSHPTRCARHGLLFTESGEKKILQSQHKFCYEPIDKNCSCLVCKNYTLAYLHHLYKAKEITGFTLATIHNIHFMMQFMHNYRKLILDNRI